MKCCKTCKFCKVSMEDDDLCYCLIARPKKFKGAHKLIAEVVGKDFSRYKKKLKATMTAEILSGMWDTSKGTAQRNLIQNTGFQVWNRGSLEQEPDK
jgi:hypothetical protein